MANLSFAWSYYLSGPHAFGFRLLNLLIHIANALLVTRFARKALERLPRPPPSGAARWLALLAGMLFLAHPLQTQSVTYVVQRMNALATLFYLTALLAWWRGRETHGAARRGWWGGALAAGLLALGSKEVAITLPVALWLCEWFFFRRLDAGFARRSALLAGPPLLLVAGFAYAAVFGDSGWGYAGRDFSFGERLLTEVRVVVFYGSLVLLPLPARQNLLHEFALSRSLFDPITTLLSALTLLGLVALAVAAARRTPLLSFAIAWYLLQLALESAVLPVALVYEHRTYLPLVGVALALPWLLYLGTGRRARATAAIGLALVALLGLATVARNAVWSDELRFWSDTAAKSPRTPGALNNLGTALMRAGRVPEALASYRRALAIDPDDAEVLNNLGTAQLALGAADDAIESFREALARDPRHFRARHNLALALARAGRLEESREELEAALQAAPTEAALWNGLGAVLVREDRLEAAARAFGRALELDPAYAEAARNLAVVQHRLRQ